MGTQAPAAAPNRPPGWGEPLCIRRSSPACRRTPPPRRAARREGTGFGPHPGCWMAAPTRHGADLLESDAGARPGPVHALAAARARNSLFTLDASVLTAPSTSLRVNTLGQPSSRARSTPGVPRGGGSLDGVGAPCAPCPPTWPTPREPAEGRGEVLGCRGR